MTWWSWALWGRTGFSKLLLGSVAERVIRFAKCPVLVVKPKVEVGLHHRRRGNDVKPHRGPGARFQERGTKGHGQTQPDPECPCYGSLAGIYSPGRTSSTSRTNDQVGCSLSWPPRAGHHRP